MTAPIIDFRSDTVTQPTQGMWKAISEAKLGDDVLGDDPTVRLLEETIAGLLGKGDAIFVPSGTMANQIAIWLGTSRGDAIAVEELSHIFHYEAGGPAVISSAVMRPIKGVRGIMDLEALQAAFPPDDPHFAPFGLVCVEDTANKGGGTVYPLERLDAIAECAHANGARTHLDGARLFNAVAASGIPAARRAEAYDTVSICFSKGLGAPVGSALCIPADLRKAAVRARKALGGGMRQSGILAAAALYALENNRGRLSEDHGKAAKLAEALRGAGYRAAEPSSNMVYLEAENASGLVGKLEERGVRALALGPTTIRLVTHLDVSPAQVEAAIRVFQDLAS
jgi:threonine aldolase